ncbi:hypothetical protein [Aquimarina sp. 2304DJ70-9]|uniref:hypothetical protein n=1 Tax=Aquimarina penaris TaxID=3231044 RepID=UPI0034631903
MMKSIFDNLYLYEIVLLFLGVFLFMLLCAGLVYFIIKKDDLKKLLLFFPIPIIMIAYPSIQEIQIEKDKIALKKFSNEVIENPQDTIAQKELTKVTNKLEKRATDIEDIKAVAEANLLLGNSEKVIDLTNKIIEEESQKTQEEVLKDSIAHTEINHRVDDKLITLKGINEVARIQKNSKNHPIAPKDTSQLKEQINRIPWSDPKTKEYLNKKIIRQNIKTDTVKS